MRYEELLFSQLSDLHFEVKTLAALMMGTPEWFNLRKACEFKGIPYNSVKVDKYRQPKFGVPDKMDGVRKYWSRKSIIEWSQVIDSQDLIKYRDRYKAESQTII